MMKTILYLILCLVLVRQAVAQDTLHIRGTITDAATKKPLQGAQVFYKDYASALTDDKGQFLLDVPTANVTISIAASGYQNKSVSLHGQPNINIALQDASFTQPGDKDINPHGAWNALSETPGSYLQGRVAGLNVTRHSGTPGTATNLNLRGFTSVYATNQPLIVVDGAIYDNEHYGSSLIGGQLANPLQDIDVKDISNITVVKDAVHTYGTKGANGVIYITTHHAQELATRIDFAAYTGVNSTPKALPLMQAHDYRIYLTDLLKTDAAYLDADDYTYHNNTDWQKLVTRTGKENNYYLRITGGDDIARYALSMGYNKNNSITDNTSLTAYRTRFNADLNLTSKLKATTSLSFTYNEQELKDQGQSRKTNPLFVALIKSPLLAVNELDNEGHQSPNLADTDVFGVSNPKALIDNAQANNKSYRFYGLVDANYSFSKQLSLTSLVGLTYDKIRENTFIPRLGVADDTLNNAVADSRMGSRVQRLFAIYNDTRLAYNIGSLKTKIGFRYQHVSTEEDYGLGYNSATDNLISIGNGAAALRVVGGDIGKNTWFNTSATADYNLYGRYFITAGVTGDVSSRFGTDAPAVALLPYVGASWLISAEKFLANTNIDLLKLRLSYGINGNDDIGNYAARRYYVSQNLLGLEGLVRGNIGNPALQWERVAKANAGLDVAILKERLSFSVDAYQHTTTHLLTYDPVQAAAGLDVVITNNAAMRTKGIDIQVNSRILNGPVRWDVGVLVSKYINTYTKGNTGTTTYAGATYITTPGQTANLFYGYRTQGIYTTHAAAAADGLYVVDAKGATTSFTGGDVKFIDRNGDKKIDENDRFVIGDPNPDWIGSISTSLNYKRWTLDALFTFSQGNDIYNATRATLESASTTDNQTLRVVNRWRADGQQTDVPKATLNDPTGNARFSDRWIEDGSYIRLRTISIAYELPVKRYLRYAKIYATANNLFTFSRYLGYDPEFSANSSIYNQGVDTGLEPIFKSVQLGVRIGL